MLLYYANLIRRRRWELYDEHQTLLDAYAQGSLDLRNNPDDEDMWAVLAYVYQRLDQVRAELLILEYAAPPDRARFMRLQGSERSSAIKRAVENGGLVDEDGRFIELEFPVTRGIIGAAESPAFEPPATIPLQEPLHHGSTQHCPRTTHQPEKQEASPG